MYTTDDDDSGGGGGCDIISKNQQKKGRVPGGNISRAVLDKSSVK